MKNKLINDAKEDIKKYTPEIIHNPADIGKIMEMSKIINLKKSITINSK